MLKRMVICPANTEPVVVNKHPGLVRQVEAHGCCSVGSQLFNWTLEEHIFEKFRVYNRYWYNQPSADNYIFFCDGKFTT